MFGIDSNAKAWKSWIEQRNEARTAHEAINVDSARSQHQAAQKAIYHVMRELSPTGSKVSEPPTPEEIAREVDKLNARISHYRMDGEQSAPRFAECSAELDKLQSAQTKVDESAASLADVEKRKLIAQKALEKIEADMPKATPKALAALEAEITSRQKQIERIDTTIASMKDETSHASAIEAEAAEAVAAVDALEADALLGEVSQADKSAAATRLAKARKAAENASQLADKQASARRGLVTRRNGLESEVTDLKEIHRGAAFELARLELVQAEAALLDALSGERLTPLLDAINRARDDLNDNAPEGTSYPTARLNIKFPFLYETTTQNSQLEL